MAYSPFPTYPILKSEAGALEVGSMYRGLIRMDYGCVPTISFSNVAATSTAQH